MKSKLLLIPILALLCGCVASRPVTHGIPNLSVVATDLYCGGEPTREGWEYLQMLGVNKTLRLDHDYENTAHVPVPATILDVEGAIPPSDLVQELTVPTQFDLKMRATWIDANVRHEKLDPILSSMSNKSEPQVGLYMTAATTKPGAVFVHCKHGQDRTRLVIAYYRVMFCGWSKATAEQEMLAWGFRKANVGLWEAWERFDPTKPVVSWIK